MRDALAGGASAIQLRAGDSDEDDIMHVGRALRAVASEHSVPFIVDGSADIAIALSADGIHVGDASTAAAARAALGPNKVLGVTLDIAAPESFAEAVSAGVQADYVFSNEVFPNAAGSAAIGVHGLAKTRRMLNAAAARAGVSTLPALVAIGGIDNSNVWSAMGRGGASGVAVEANLLDARDPARGVALIREAVDDVHSGGF